MTQHRIRTATLREVQGCCLQGYLKATTEDIMTFFGDPLGGDGGYKSDVNWDIKIDNEVIATIYNWKNEQPSRDVWHIGGRSTLAVQLVKDIMGDKAEVWFN